MNEEQSCEERETLIATSDLSTCGDSGIPREGVGRCHDESGLELADVDVRRGWNPLNTTYQSTELSAR